MYDRTLVTLVRVLRGYTKSEVLTRRNSLVCGKNTYPVYLNPLEPNVRCCYDSMRESLGGVI